MDKVFIAYFVFGIGFYIGMVSANPKGFVKADAASILRGILLGIFFWPIGLIVRIYLALEDLNG